MQLTMARKKPEPEDQPKRPARTGSPLHAWIDPAIMEALDAYVESTEPRVTKTSTIETAIKDFLRRQGRWPPKTD